MTISTESSSFADELRSACVRIDQKVISHLYFSETKQRLLEALGTHNIVLLVGPSGVGKGTLIRVLLRQLNGPVEGDPTAIRAVSFRAPSPHGPTFPWKAFWIAWLNAMQDPLPERKVDRKRALSRMVNDLGRLKPSDTVDGMRDAVFSATRDRGARVVVIDEALNLVQNEKGGHTLRNRLDVLRDISDEAGCRIVLVSTPRILEKLELSCELARRMREVIFWRYTFGEELYGENFEAFRDVARSFLQEVPKGERPSLSSRKIQLLQAGSIGCVGILSSWFQNAITRCMWSGSSALEWRHFEDTVLPDPKLREMRRVCEDGEREFQRLSARSYETLVGEAAGSTKPFEGKGRSPDSGNKGKHTPPPGTRNPKRDKLK